MMGREAFTNPRRGSHHPGEPKGWVEFLFKPPSLHWWLPFKRVKGLPLPPPLPWAPWGKEEEEKVMQPLPRTQQSWYM